MSQSTGPYEFGKLWRLPHTIAGSWDGWKRAWIPVGSGPIPRRERDHRFLSNDNLLSCIQRDAGRNRHDGRSTHRRRKPTEPRRAGPHPTATYKSRDAPTSVTPDRRFPRRPLGAPLRSTLDDDLALTPNLTLTQTVFRTRETSHLQTAYWRTPLRSSER